jgi:GT2 family glycosyltransferase
MTSVYQEPVYIIIPVHNRKQITLKCLDTLKQNGDMDKYHIVVVDDGSTDGTPQAIQSLYPEITILHGDGNLWWTGGIKKGMEYAYQQGAEYFIWLNDDCYPQAQSIQKLISFCQDNPKIIAGGQSLDPDCLKPSYGGIIRHWNRIEQVHCVNNLIQECDGLAGNFVCIPRQVVDVVGYPNASLFPHYYGDVIYTNKAQKVGYSIIIFAESIAYCKNETNSISWLTSELNLLDFWSDYFKIKSPFYWRAELFFYINMMGMKGFLIYWYERIFKFWCIWSITKIIPIKYRYKIKYLLQTMKFNLKNSFIKL